MHCDSRQATQGNWARILFTELPLGTRRLLPEESREKIRHKLHGQEAIVCPAGHFRFAFTSLFIEDVRELLVTHK